MRKSLYQRKGTGSGKSLGRAVPKPMYGQGQGVNIQNIDIDINKVIGVTVEQHVEQVPKVGRDERCPCGSGKKYKKCHGDPVRQQHTALDSRPHVESTD